MANQSHSSYQVLWNTHDIQQFIGSTQCRIQDYTHELVTLECGSNFVLPCSTSSSGVSREKSSAVTSSTHCNENVMPSGDEVVEEILGPDDLALQGDETTDTPVSVTALGLLLLATITHQQKSYVLKESIKQIISESLTMHSFKELAKNYPHLKTLSLSGLLGFAAFCIGHCTMCDVDGHIVKDVAVLQAWCDVVEPLKTLIERTVIDHVQENTGWILPLPQPANVSSLKSYLISQKAATYATFNSYDFSHDARYKAGAQQIMRKLQAESAGRDSNRKELELEAKLFYFSRFFDKVNKEDYMIWLSQQQETSSTLEMVVQDQNTADMPLPATRREDSVSRSKHFDKDPDGTDKSVTLVQSLPSNLLHTASLPDHLIKQLEGHVSIQTLPSVAHISPATNLTDSLSSSRSSVSTSSDLQMGKKSADELPSTLTSSGVGETIVSAAPTLPQNNASALLLSATSNLQMQPSTWTQNQDIGVVKCEGSNEYSSVASSTHATSNEYSSVSSSSHATSTDTFIEHIPQSSFSNKNICNMTGDSNHDPSEIDSNPNPVNSDPPPYPASFLEILRLVESGQEIPGIEILDIKPTDAPLTESEMKPVKKPWLK